LDSRCSKAKAGITFEDAFGLWGETGVLLTGILHRIAGAGIALRGTLL
jgi:hypothetical protein